MSISATTAMTIAPVFDKTPTAQVSDQRARDGVNDTDDKSVGATAIPASAKPPEGQGRFVDKSV